MKKFFNLTHRMRAAGVILILSLSLTLWMWQLSKANLQNLAREQFEFRVAEIVSAIHQRMQAYEQILRGGVGLFAASDRVSQEEWKVYVDHLKIQENYPGISGIGFCQRISSVQAKEPICRGDTEAFFDDLLPSGVNRSAHTPPIYLEPRTGKTIKPSITISLPNRCSMVPWSMPGITEKPLFPARSTWLRKPARIPRRAFSSFCRSIARPPL
jgi:hypothetical protein